MTSLDLIKAPVSTHLAEFDGRFKTFLKSRVLLLDTVTRYIYRKKGKQIRPLFVFLSAGSCGGVTESTHVAASLIEMLHTATLVHDDVVDDSHLRRGLFSVNALWKNKIAVLTGDFLLSQGMLLALERHEFGLLEIVSRAVREMSEGELLQIEKARRLDISETVYFEIIRMKTASLIAACCACGAASAGATDDLRKRMRQFGEIAGIAFQIKDDLLDYTSGKITGKPGGIDIRDQKLTLPLIHLLQHSGYSGKRWIINTVKHHNTDPGRVEQLIEMVISEGGLDYARQRMEDYRDEALELLGQIPPSEYRNALEKLVVFTTEREK